MNAEHLEKLGVNIAWLAAAATRDHLQTTSMAEGRFMFDPAFAAWSRTHYPTSDSVTTLLVDDVDAPSWHTTQANGDVACTMPIRRLVDAEAAGRLEDQLVEVFAEVFSRWAEVNGKPAPPPVDVATLLPGLYIDAVLSSHGAVGTDSDIEATPIALRANDP